MAAMIAARLRSGPRVLHDALADPSAEVRLAGLAMAVDEGLGRYASILARHVPVERDDRVVAAIRQAVLDDMWPPDRDRWGELLLRWAEDRPLGGSLVVAPDGVVRQPKPRPAPTVGVTRTARALSYVLDLGMLGTAVVVVGRRVGAFTGLPKGYDAISHVTEISMLSRQLPHVQWNPTWYGGMPWFQSSYPPLSHLLGAVIELKTGWSAASVVNDLNAASFLCIVGFLYLTVRMLSGRRLAALSAGVLMLACPALWYQVLVGGTFSRVFAAGCMAPAVFFAASYARRPTRARYVGAVVALAATLLAHFLPGIIACGAVGALLVAVPARNVRLRLWRAAGVGLPAAGLAGMFYVPMALLPLPKTTPALAIAAPPWRALFTAGPRILDSAMPAATVPLALLAVIAALAAVATHRRMTVSPHRQLILDWTSLRYLASPTTVDARPASPARAITPLTGPGWGVDLMAACGIGAAGLACLGWAFAGHSGHQINLLGISPADFLTYAAWLVLAAMCTFLGRAPGRTPWVRAWPSVIALVAALLSFAYCVGRLSAVRADANANELRQLEQTLPAEAAHQTAYRIGMNSDGVDQWVNLRSDTPIVRGIQAQGIVNLDWQFWVERALRDGAMAQAERAFTFDWYGVKWMFADDPTGGVEKVYKSNPSEYKLVRTTPDAAIPVYRNLHASPVGVATNATTALVIGSPEEYSLVFRALSFSGTDSSRIVPIQGGPWVDAFTSQQLRGYDSVVLYGARAHSWSRAGRVLDQYVRRGGRLVIEQADSPLRADLPSVYPVSGLARRTVTGGWPFHSTSSNLLNHFDLTSFSPPRWGAVPTWDVITARSVAAWAQPVLSIGNEVLIAEGALGTGHVYYSGLNLPYHIASFSNGAESSLLAAMISPGVSASSAKGVTVGPTALVASTAEAAGPEHEVIQAPTGARGVVYKETYSADWKATVNGRAVHVERAGPSFMYVRLTGSGPATVSFTYQQIGVEKAGWALSGLTAILLVLFLAGVRPPSAVRRWRDRCLGR